MNVNNLPTVDNQVILTQIKTHEGHNDNFFLIIVNFMLYQWRIQDFPEGWR